MKKNPKAWLSNDTRTTFFSSRKNVVLYGILFFLSINLSAQKKDIEELYLEYFKLPRETLFLHTNKTIYFSNEDIWFKVYAFDRKNELSSKATSNVYLGLYDKKGKELDKRLYRSMNGAANGSFLLDSTLTSGEYYLKVSTNWMKNFSEDDSFIQKIQVINPNQSEDITNEISKVEYDFQFLPEGGHLLSDVKNSVGIKAIDDQGKGILANGSIINSKNEEVANFRSNILGIGKFTFTPVKGETYTARVNLDNGKEFTSSLPEIRTKGVSLIVNNALDSKVIIKLSTNSDSWDQVGGEKYKLLLHKDGKVKSSSILWKEPSLQITLKKEDLFPGVNTVTLFNEKNEPLIERMFFNAQGAVRNLDLFVDNTGADLDSITFRLKSKKMNQNEVLSASVSVLPGETVSYDPDHSIISAVHLKPYVKGVVENPQYYFRNFDRKKQYELDALLITQGWSRYSWDRIFNFPPTPSFDFENGITINGFVTNKTSKISTMMLYPSSLNTSILIPLDETGKFNLKNFYPEIGEEISFSFIGKKGKIKKPNMSLSFIQLMSKDRINTKDYQSFTSYYKDKSKIPDNFIIDDSYEELDEIRIKTDLKRKLQKELRDPILVNGKVTKIGQDEVNLYPTILDMIQNRGYDVIQNLGQVRISARTRGNNGVTPTVFLDGIIINGSLNVLFNFPTENVDKIVIDPTGIGLGLSGGFGGAIKIFTRNKVYNPLGDVSNIKNDLFTSKVKYGFEPTKEFYTPKYASYKMQSFKNYGIIHWDPDVTLTSGISKDLKMINTELEEINFYIEGISSDGSVFSQFVKYTDENRPK